MEDRNSLQDDFQKLEEWREEWDGCFHPNKCSVLTVNHRLTTSKHKYSLYDHVLENASSAKYLGVTLQHNAQFNQHIDTVVAKVNRTLGC